MANPTRLEGDVYVSGNLSAQTMTPNTNSITDSMVNAAADIAATKLEHQYKVNYGEESATAATALVRPIHVVYGTAGSIVAFSVSSVVAASGAGASVEVDLLKNGTTVLTTKAILTTNETAYETVNAVIGTTVLAAGDVLEMSIGTPTATAPKGISVDLTIREGAV